MAKCTPPCRSEGVVEVVPEVVDVFDADAEAEQPGGEVLLAGDAARRSMVDSTAPKLVAWRMTAPERTPVGCCGAAGDVEGDDAAEAGQMLGGDRDGWGERPVRVAHPLDARVGLEPAGELRRWPRPLPRAAGRCGCHAWRGTSRACRASRRGARGGCGGVRRGRAPGRDDAAQQIGVPAEVLGRGLHGDVCAEVERLLAEGPARVLSTARIDSGACGGGDPAQVGDLEQRVRWRLDPDEVSGRGRVAPGVGVDRPRGGSWSIGRAVRRRRSSRPRPGSSRRATRSGRPREAGRTPQRWRPCPS